jgi:transcriptional regulator with XRE-family HTH domain
MNFRRLRESAGFTQESLAAEIRCDQTAISQMETGKVRDPKYSTVISLAKALRTTPDAVASAIKASCREASAS